MSDTTTNGGAVQKVVRELPARETMLEAFLERDEAFEGVFVTAVVTTGIFCRPTCAARKPKPQNVEFFATPREALVAGYRPCPCGRPARRPRGSRRSSRRSRTTRPAAGRTPTCGSSGWSRPGCGAGSSRSTE